MLNSPRSTQRWPTITDKSSKQLGNFLSRLRNLRTPSASSMSPFHAQPADSYAVVTVLNATIRIGDDFDWDTTFIAHVTSCLSDAFLVRTSTSYCRAFAVAIRKIRAHLRYVDRQKTG